jgi:hypothetical protein
MHRTPFRLFLALIGISLVVGLAANGERAKAAPSICNWIANASSLSYDWGDYHNWGCSGVAVPDANTIVVIAAPNSAYAPHVRASASALSIQLTGYLFIDASYQLTVVALWSNAGNATIDSQGTLIGLGEVTNLGAVHFLSSGTLQGNLVIDSGATASVAVLYAYGNVTNNGTLTGESPDAQFHMRGALFTNNGTVATNAFTFDKGGPQSVTGSGVWTGSIANLFVTGPTQLTAESDLVFSPQQFNINNDGSTFNIGAYQVTFNGPGQLIISGTLTGAAGGKVHTMGTGMEIHIPNGGTFNPPLVVDSGTTHAFGTFSGSITIATGATLLVMDPPGTLTAIPGVTVNGTLGGEDDTAVFEAGGGMTVNGQVTVANLRLLGNWEMIIGGSGSMNLHSLEVSPGLLLLLMVPLQLDNTLTLSGDISAPFVTITLAETAVIAGSNANRDIFSVVQRNGPFQKGKSYCFGNQYLSITFANSSTSLPTSVTMQVSQVPWGDLNDSIKRSYSIQTGGVGNWSADLRLDYRNNEFAGNPALISAWTRSTPSNPWQPQAISQSNTSQNWVEFDGLTHFSDWGLVLTKVFLPFIRR